MKRLIYFVLPLLLSFLTASCEKADLGKSGEDGKEVENGVKVKFCVTKFEQIPFDEKSMPSRATSDIKDICTRISFAIYKADGDVYDVKNQQADDSGFGTLSISLPEGDYRLIVIAHCGLGVSTFEAEDKVKFKDNKVTDTFYCCQDFTVTKGASYNLELKRAVSKFRLVIDDSIPSNVSKMKFYYPEVPLLSTLKVAMDASIPDKQSTGRSLPRCMARAISLRFSRFLMRRKTS